MPTYASKLGSACLPPSSEGEGERAHTNLATQLMTAGAGAPGHTAGGAALEEVRDSEGGGDIPHLLERQPTLQVKEEQHPGSRAA